MFSFFKSSTTPFRPSITSFSPEKGEGKAPPSISQVIEEGRWYTLSNRLFGNRQCPGYLENTSLEGAISEESVDHWLEVISLWLNGDGLFFPVTLTESDYRRLKEVLLDYKTRLNRTGECREEAQKTLSEIQKGLNSNGVVYIPLGYRSTINNPGHAIPAKFRKYRDKIEVLFLNAGDGMQLHPELSWSETSAVYHFQSFPVHFDEKVLFGKQGIELFTRLFFLDTKTTDYHEGYSAEDVYGAFWLLGKMQSSFDSKVADRAKKPQGGLNCGDMAISLLLRDILIDLGCNKKQIQRFFCNELLGNLLCYFNQKPSDRGEWLLFRAALEGFSTRTLHLCGGSLDEKEVIFCKEILCDFFEKTVIQLKKQQSEDPVPATLEKVAFWKMATQEIDYYKVDIAPNTTYDLEIYCDSSIEIINPQQLSPERLLQTVRGWEKTAADLHASSQKTRARQFVYRSMITLPIPDPLEPGYWGDVPAIDRPEILRILSLLICHGIHKEEQDTPSFYKQIFILHCAYAISDKLARLNPETMLTGFASPFFATKLKNYSNYFFFNFYMTGNFEFLLLPLGPLNSKWSAICHYFDTHLASSTYTLFALPEKTIDLEEGVRELSHLFFNLVPTSPVGSHLQYLKQFIPSQEVQEQEALISYFSTLWTNKTSALPFEYSALYFFAYYAWAFFTYNGRKLANLSPENRFDIATCDPTSPSILTLPIRHTLKYSALGETPYNLGIDSEGFNFFGSIKEEGRRKTENESNCCSPCSRFKPFSTKNFRQWCRIFSNPSLQISSTIHWLNHSLTEMHHVYNQHLVETALFDPGLLPQKIKDEPAYLFRLRKCIHKGIKYFNTASPNIPTLVFFIRLGLCIETFSNEVDLEALKRYEKILLLGKEHGKDSWRCYSHLALLYQIALPHEEDSLKEMVKAQFWLNFLDREEIEQPSSNNSKLQENRHWIWQEIEWSTDLHQPLLQDLFENRIWVEKIAQEILNLFSLTIPEDPSVEASFPFIHYGEYTFDIEKMTLRRNKTEQLVSLKYLEQHMLVWMEKDHLLLSDESLKFEKEEGRLTLAKKFEGQWYYKINLRSVALNHALFMRHELWVKEGEPNIFLFCKKDIPCYITLEDGKIQKLSSHEQLHLLDPESSQLFPFFKALGAEMEACCWIKPGSNRIEELDFLELGLSFKGEEIDGTWRLRSIQFPLYFLAENSHEEINHFRGAFILENAWDTIVVIPARRLDKEDDDFTTQAHLSDLLRIQSLNYFFFHLDKQSNLLISDNPLANIFLTLLFATQRDYKRALRYLPRAAAFRYHLDRGSSFILINSFQELKDLSPEALAFYMRFGMHLFENHLQLLKQGFQRKADQKFLANHVSLWLKETYKKYLRVLSSKEESRVPGYIRLTREEEALFLKLLKSDLKKAEEENPQENPLGALSQFIPINTSYTWEPIFEVREQLLANGGDHLRIQIPVKEYHSFLNEQVFIPLQNLEPSNLPPPNFDTQVTTLTDFVRMTEKEVRTHFILLYEEAKKKDSFRAELDILYLFRSKNETASSYGALLLYVHKNSGAFQDLVFGEDPKENLKTFKEIAKRATGLLAVASKVGSVTYNAFTQTILFRYQFACHLQLPKPPSLQPLKWQFAREDVQSFKLVRASQYNFFLKNGLKHEKVPHATADRPFVFNSFALDNPSPTEQKLVADLCKGYARCLNPKYGKSLFTLDDPPDIFIKKARLLLTKVKKHLEALKKDAEAIANSYSTIDYRVGLRKCSRDLPEITMEGILSDAYSKTDPMIIRRANPTLSSSSISEALKKTVEYHLTRIHLFQLEKAINSFENTGNIQAFGECIAVYGDIDPSQEPEIILFQSRTGITLREKQMEVLIWQFQSSHITSLFCAPAGGGKTTILQPITMQRLKRLGQFPVSVSPKPLYYVDREALRHSAQHAHSLSVEVLELSLDTQMTPLAFQRVYEQLMHYAKEKGLKITPETYYALELKYRLALETGDHETVRWTSLILDILETKVTVHIDECRLELSPFTQSKTAIGAPIPLPEIDRHTFLTIYRMLVSQVIALQDGRTVDSVVRLTFNQQATMTESDLFLVKEAVLKSLIKESKWLFGLAQTEKERAHDLMEIYFEVFFSAAMKLVGKMKHVGSLKEDEAIHVPAHKRQATKAYFEEAHVTLIATIHGLLQEGLNPDQIQQLVGLLHKEHVEQIGSSERVSEIEQTFQEWVEDDKARLKDFKASNRQQMDLLHQKIAKHREVIFWYLEKYALQQATYCSKQLVVTPVHFLNAFHSAILFSADPGPQEIYGPSLQRKGAVKTDPIFAAQVVHQLSAPQNERVLSFPFFSRPLELFEYLLNTCPEVYLSLSMLADAGMLRDFSTTEIAKDFFLFLKNAKELVSYDGMILFEEASDKSTEGELLLWLKGWSEPKVLKGSEIVFAINALGLRWEDLNLLTLIDPSHNTGANIKQKEGSTALLLLTEEFPQGDAIQTVMRMRDFLVSQSIIWGLTDALYVQVERTMQAKINPTTLQLWLLRNEGQRIDKEIPLAAFQQIAYIVEEPARNELRKHLHDPDSQIRIWSRYQNGFVKNTNPDLVLRFKQKARLVDTKKVLLAYAMECYKSFGYSIPWKDATSIHKAIRLVIEGTAARKPQISSHASLDLMQQTHMHVSQEQLVELDQIQETRFNLTAVSSTPLSELITIDAIYLVEVLAGYSRKATDVFGSKGFTSRLWFTSNALQTAKMGKTQLNETFLKPVQYILIILEEELWSAFALSDLDAAHFQKQLASQTQGAGKVALINSDGLIIQNGKGPFALSSEELDSLFVQDVLIDVGLSQCVLHHPERFLSRLEKWDDFWPMWKRLKTWQPLPQETRPALIERLVPPSLRKVKKIEKPKRGLFSWFS